MAPFCLGDLEPENDQQVALDFVFKTGRYPNNTAKVARVQRLPLPLLPWFARFFGLLRRYSFQEGEYHAHKDKGRPPARSGVKKAPEDDAAVLPCVAYHAPNRRKCVGCATKGRPCLIYKYASIVEDEDVVCMNLRACYCCSVDGIPCSFLDASGKVDLSLYYHKEDNQYSVTYEGARFDVPMFSAPGPNHSGATATTATTATAVGGSGPAAGGPAPASNLTAVTPMPKTPAQDVIVAGTGEAERDGGGVQDDAPGEDAIEGPEQPPGPQEEGQSPIVEDVFDDFAPRNEPESAPAAAEDGATNALVEQDHGPSMEDYLGDHHAPVNDENPLDTRSRSRSRSRYSATPVKRPRSPTRRSRSASPARSRSPLPRRRARLQSDHHPSRTRTPWSRESAPPRPRTATPARDPRGKTRGRDGVDPYGTLADAWADILRRDELAEYVITGNESVEMLEDREDHLLRGRQQYLATRVRFGFDLFNIRPHEVMFGTFALTRDDRECEQTGRDHALLECEGFVQDRSDPDLLRMYPDGFTRGVGEPRITRPVSKDGETGEATSSVRDYLQELASVRGRGRGVFDKNRDRRTGTPPRDPTQAPRAAITLAQETADSDRHYSPDIDFHPRQLPRTLPASPSSSKFTVLSAAAPKQFLAPPGSRATTSTSEQQPTAYISRRSRKRPSHASSEDDEQVYGSSSKSQRRKLDQPAKSSPVRPQPLVPYSAIIIPSRRPTFASLVAAIDVGVLLEPMRKVHDRRDVLVRALAGDTTVVPGALGLRDSMLPLALLLVVNRLRFNVEEIHLQRSETSSTFATRDKFYEDATGSVWASCTAPLVKIPTLGHLRSQDPCVMSAYLSSLSTYGTIQMRTSLLVMINPLSHESIEADWKGAMMLPALHADVMGLSPRPCTLDDVEEIIGVIRHGDEYQPFRLTRSNTMVQLVVYGKDIAAFARLIGFISTLVPSTLCFSPLFFPVACTDPMAMASSHLWSFFNGDQPDWARRRAKDRDRGARNALIDTLDQMRCISEEFVLAEWGTDHPTRLKRWGLGKGIVPSPEESQQMGYEADQESLGESVPPDTQGSEEWWVGSEG